MKNFLKVIWWEGGRSEEREEKKIKQRIIPTKGTFFFFVLCFILSIFALDNMRLLTPYGIIVFTLKCEKEFTYSSLKRKKKLFSPL